MDESASAKNIPSSLSTDNGRSCVILSVIDSHIAKLRSQAKIWDRMAEQAMRDKTLSQTTVTTKQSFPEKLARNVGKNNK